MMSWEIESAKFTSLTIEKLQIQSSQINDVNIKATASFKLHEFLSVQAREKQAYDEEILSQLLNLTWIPFSY